MLRTYHTTPQVSLHSFGFSDDLRCSIQVQVIVGGYASYCSSENNDCDFQWSTEHTPTIESVDQNGTMITIRGTGFSSILDANTVLIGENGWCDVQTANSTSISCTITKAPSGRQTLRVNVAEKGLASSNRSFTVIVPLSIHSFTPNAGDAGGGYQLTIVGSGFSSGAIVMLGENFCPNQIIVNFTVITCIVPPSGSVTVVQATVTVVDGLNSAHALGQFMYNTTNIPTISAIYPTFVTMTGGLLNINGSGFGIRGVSVFVNMSSISVLTLSDHHILVNLSALPPGRYPVTVLTQMGYARPLFHIEYRFYVQQVSPQVGSAYGGTDVYIQGAGFENGTLVQLRDQLNALSPCDIISVQSSQIHCRTTPITRQAIITSNGIHPTYGFGYAWLPAYRTVQQGTNVTWSWSSAQLLRPVYYKVQQLDGPYSEEPLLNGFDSGLASSVGECELYWANHVCNNLDCYRYLFIPIRRIRYILLLVTEC